MTKVRLDLSNDQRELLLELRARRRGPGAGTPELERIERRMRPAELELSFGQERLWFLEQMEPGTAFYNVPGAVRIRGRLAPDTLEHVLQEIVSRHESLRTTFAAVDGVAVASVEEEVRLALPVEDLGHLGASERERVVTRRVAVEAESPFDLGRAPLLRAVLLRLASDEHVLILTMHHIVSDGWSIGVLVREAAALYAAFSDGRPSPLPPLSIQYADYAAWQRRILTGPVVDRQLDYWRGQLADAPAALELPTDRPRPAAQTFRGATRSFELSRELRRGLEDLGRAEGATLFMTLLAGFQLLLSRYARQYDVVVGSPIAGRTRAETENLIGFFVNTLALRTRLDGDPTFRELLGRVRRTALEAYAHQDLPFERLVQELSPERDPSRSPLFQVMFALQNTPTEALALGALELEPMALETSTAKFDLTLTFEETPRGLAGTFEYNTDLFDAATIERMEGNLRVLLGGAASRPDDRAFELPILPDVERQQLLVEWNATELDLPRPSCLHELFEDRARRDPDAVAVIAPGGASITYGALDRRASWFAHRLCAMGVTRGDRVAVCLSRSIDLVVGILAIAKAGAAYVPLDPSYPAERLAYMVSDSAVRVAVSVRRLATAVPAVEQVLWLDEQAGEVALGPHHTRPSPPGSLAYVIYTSGSTGRPKGVAVGHAGVANAVWWFLSIYGLEPSDRGALISSPSFDASVLEIWPCLVGGLSLAIPDDDTRDSPVELLRWVDEQRVTVCSAPTPLAEAMLDVMEAGAPAALRCLVTGGDALRRRPRPGSTVVVGNHYGPTENSVDTTAGRVPAGDDGGKLPSIGRPVANHRVHLVDDRLQLVPSISGGELCAAGVGLAWGYLGRPRETAVSFVPDPFSVEGGRLYRTGDLARRSPDGSLEFLGRIDQQVKVRGFRIELGEVENVLAQHPALRDVVVMARADARGDAALVAYVVASAAPPPSGELRAWLRRSLPEHMVPSVFVPLDALPLTPNGKLDRRALPAPESSSSNLYVAPRPGIEEVVARVWSEVLGVDRVGAHDSFFELGGHSLLATRVASRLRTACGVDVPLRSLFEATTVAQLAVRIEAAQRRSRDGAEAMVIARRRPDDELALSFGQERLWFLEQLEPGSAFYNISGAVRLRGALRDDVLARALGEVVRRHEVLRTQFAEVDGHATATVVADASVDLELVDLRPVPEPGRSEEVRRQASEEARTPFDLRCAPLLRARLLRLEDQEHVLLVTMHHVVSDGWSIGVFVREAAVLYGAMAGGREAPLAELPVQYADFAAWQRKVVSGTLLDRQIEYWREQLRGAPAALEMPTDRPRPATQTYRGATRSFELPMDLRRGLEEVGRAGGATLFMTLLAGFQLLLSRYTGQPDVVVGTPIAGRTRSETEGLIGFFVNTLALRLRVDEASTFRQLVSTAREVSLGGYGNQDVPFERLVQELSPQRDASRSPVFQVMFVLQNAPTAVMALGDLEVEPLDLDTGTAKLDLTLTMTETERGLSCTLEYNTDLFDAGTMARLEGHLRVLLEAAARHPDLPLEQLPWLPEEEWRQVVVEWNDTTKELPERCVHEEIEAQVSRTPDAVAVEIEGRRLSYRELDERANRLAWWLRGQGVGRDVQVGVCMERSLELVVALLGVLKAGGAYVPLDPGYPADRLSFMLADAAAPVVLTQRGLRERLGETTASVLCLDAAEEVLAAESSVKPPCPVGGWDLVYVIYTSGSTGRPKGAMNVHRGLANRLAWMQSAYPLTPSDRVLQKTPFGFDVSVWEFFWPLMMGARLVMARPGGHQDPAYLVELIREQGITVLHFVPSMLQVFLEQPGVERCESLRHVICSGEALPLELQERHFAKLQAPLHNLYGPTEASIDVTYWDCERGGSRRSVPIGRPIANTQVYVLDGQKQPLPIGVAGELYLGGVGLARGYWNRPELTEERFVADPFSSDAAARLYRTGDRARWLAEGVVEYLGRLDHQVKVRGFRIELGEIEVTLAQHPGVREALVMAREDSPGDVRLVGYVVPSATVGPSASDLRAWLKARVPEFMVPSAFVMLAALPVTPNGKVDRKALPAPEVATSTAYVAPRDGVEQVVASIWSEVLGGARVGAHDGFFELGGHSLLATRVASRLRKTFGVDLPLRSLFEAPTVAQLAERIEAAQGRGESAEEEPLERVVRGEGELALSFGQERLWFLEQLAPGTAFYNIPGAVRLRGPLRAEVLEEALQAVVRRHEALRTSFAEVDGRPTTRVADDARLVLGVVDLSELEADAREAAVREQVGAEARAPFDLGRAPLVRASLLRLSDDEHVLLVTMHHIVSDGWSIGVFVQEAAVLYEALASGQPSALPELAIQYADYAAWQRRVLSGGLLERQLRYWRAQLADAPAALELPTDRPRPATQTYRGATRSFELPVELRRGLEDIGRAEGATLFMTLLAGFQLLLSQYAGQDDVVVGTPIAGRTRTETEGLIGFLVNTLALRTRLDGDPTFRELVRRVRETALGAYAHQDVPFERLVQELSPQRDASRSALFQVMFVLQSAPSEPARLGGLQVEPLDMDTGTAKFDVTLRIVEAGGALTCAIDYNTDLFEAPTIARMEEHLRVVLAGAVANADRRISEAELTSPAEQARLVAAWNDTEAPAPTACLHELFEAQVERTPDGTALVFEGEHLTYRELDRRANDVAVVLRERGVAPEVRVGLLFRRSPAMVIAMLGVLKAGGAYVPLDPEHPSERSAFTLRDSGAEILLTDESSPTSIFDPDRTLRYQDVPRAGGRRATAGGATTANLAYVIYTSGSTGRPKGVAVEHQAITNHLEARQRLYPLHADDAFLQKASVGFDISVWEIFGPLARGSRLVLARPGGQKDPAYLAQLVRESMVTVVHFGPAALWPFLEELGPLGAPTVRRVFCGGEPLRADLQRQVFQRLSASLHHQYGPTEAVVDVTFFDCRAADERQRIPIGKAIDNARIRVLGPGMQVTSTGIPGELYVGGLTVARGYLNQPALTAARFVPDRFGDGSRIYATGDLVRFTEDAELEFLRRIDGQIKIRGFRVELGEIEVSISRCTGVRAAVATVVEDPGGNRRLVAYWVGHPDAPPTSAAAIRDQLKVTLPDHMIPSALVELEALPLTTNGKVDRRALPVPMPESRSSAHVAPRNGVERELAAIWSEILGAPQVGIHDDFFELGGHSLLATRVASRVRRAFGVELPLRALFECTTVAELAGRVNAAQEAGDIAAVAPLQRAGRRDGEQPLSFGQERLWFLEQLEPGTAFYNIPGAVRMTGVLRADVLERALAEVVRRHETLRTSFAEVDGRPVVRVAGDARLELAQTDLGQLPAAQRSTAVHERIAAEARAPFDLGRAPLVRASLLRLADREHVLLLTMHHIVSDGWSVGVLVRETAQLYSAFAAGRPSPLAELPLQYADHAAWQRKALTGELLERQLAYWREHLGGAPAALELPTDRPRPPTQTFHGATRSFVLSTELRRRLETVGRDVGATMFMTLLAGFQLLLSRYSGQDDVVVGTPIAGRTHLETEGLIGFFVNTLALRARLDGNPSFRELVRRTKATALGAYAHQDLPFERLVKELSPERDASRTPLFQVMFVLQNARSQALTAEGLQLEPLDLDTATAKFDLTLTMAESEQGLTGALNYNTDLYDAETIERMEEHLRCLLTAATSEPDRAALELPMLGEPERHRLTVEWNATRVDYPRDPCMHEMFEAQAARTPDATAVVCGNHRVTYAELDRRSDALACELQRLGAGPESLVGVCLERSIEIVVALLGVLKAGAAYVPLDPAYPKERLAFMLEDTRASIVITQRSVAAALPEGARQLLLDGPAAVRLHGRTRPARRAAADRLGYVIYTSGSTGRAKGVAIEHRSAVTLMHWARDVFEPSELAVVLASTSICFDLSVFEIFVPLAWGGTVVVARDALELPELEGKHAITLVNTVPSAMTELVRMDGVPASVRTVNLAGEPLHNPLVAKILELGTVERVFDLYGPSEDTTYSTVAARDGRTRASIGRPLANTQAYVLDARAGLVPTGVGGELCLGGAGLARGYLRRPELTADRFVPDPFSTDAGARMYRTGDRVRWLPDARLEYVGRFDHQVKVRGFRIELGEIETRLTEHAGIREAVALVREDAPGDKRIVAYLVPSASPAPTPADLRAWLKTSLPEYMVPSAFVTLEALPLTPNGKVDRKALPAPGAEARASSEYVAPQDVVEEALASIWAHVLGLVEAPSASGGPTARAKVGIDDNFFALGGDSLLIIKVVARANSANLRLHPRQIFEHPTVRQLAAAVRESTAAAARREVAVAPLAPSQLAIVEELGPRDLDGACESILLRVHRALDAAIMDRALAEVLRHHEALRARHRVVDGAWVQDVGSVGASTPVVAVDLSSVAVEARAGVVAEHTERARSTLSIGDGSLARVVLFGLGPAGCDVLVVVHRLAIDAASWPILVGDLWTVYADVEAGRAPRLPPRTASFNSWSSRLQDLAKSASFAAELAFWRSVTQEPLSGEVPSVAGGPRRGGEVLGFELGHASSTAVLERVPMVHGLEVPDVLVAALARPMAQWMKRPTVSLDVESASRDQLDDLDTTRTIGCFTTRHPIQVEVVDEPEDETLRRVAEWRRGAPGGGVGFGVATHVIGDPSLRSRRVPDVLLRYLGDVTRGLDAVTTSVEVLRGPARSPSAAERPPAHSIEFVVSVVDGVLQVAVAYDPERHPASTVEWLARGMQDELETIVAFTTSNVDDIFSQVELD